MGVFLMPCPLGHAVVTLGHHIAFGFGIIADVGGVTSNRSVCIVWKSSRLFYFGCIYVGGWRDAKWFVRTYCIDGSQSNDSQSQAFVDGDAIITCIDGMCDA